MPDVRGSWLAGVAALAACAVAASPAHAHGDEARNRVLTQDGEVVLLHSDAQRLGLTEEQMAASWGEAPRRRAVGRAGEAVEPATTWCGELRATDDVEHARTTLPRYKVVYAYASDLPNRMATNPLVPGFGGVRHRDVLQQSATWVRDKFLDGSTGQRGVRFDYGTSCGPQYLDILTLKLPGDKAFYNASAQLRAERVRDAVLDARESMQLDRGTWDWLVFADTGPAPSNWFYAEAWFEHAGAADPNPATNPNARADQMAILHSASYDGTYGIGYTAYVATHEVIHTLGAVVQGALHRTPGFHCTDLYSVMCYRDNTGDPADFDEVCDPSKNGVEVPTTMLQFDEIALDCNSDDYFNLSLGALPHWNVNASPSVCPAAQCLASTLEPLATATGSPGPATAGSPVHFDASGSTDRDGAIVRYDWDVDGAGGIDQTTTGPGLEIVPRRSGTVGGGTVTVTDDDGFTDTVGLPAFAVAGRPPAMMLAVPGPQPVGTPLVLDASGSADPDEGGAITTYRFTLPDGSSSSGASPRLTWTPQRPGRYEVRVTGIDDEGRTADATATVDVVDLPPSAPPPGGITATGKRSVLPSLRRYRSGTIVARVRCTKRRTCRLRLTAGPVRRDVRVRAGRTTRVRLRLPARLRHRTVRFTLRDRATGRRLARRTLAPPRR